MGPDGTALTPEEWDAVRRLRGERSADSQTPPAEPAATTPVEPPEPGPEPEQISATGEPLAPVEPPPPPQETAPPVEEQTAVEPTRPPQEPARPLEAPLPVAPSGGEAAPFGEAPSVGEPMATSQPPEWGGAGEPGTLASAPALGVLVVLAVVLVVLAALVGLRVSDRHARNSASTAALSAASSGVATVLSYNYRSLDHDFATAESLLTPAFRKAYVATTAKAVQPLAAKYQAVSTAQVSAAGVISASSSRAVVLVFVSQTVTNTQLSAPRLDRSRIQVELVHTHGSWLINKLTPL